MYVPVMRESGRRKRNIRGRWKVREWIRRKREREREGDRETM